ncbi:MAG: DNA polymerase Y family protein [Corynebacterium sp.]|uniref:Y-family DNA polymerase n=1 Tax=Corynebacterium sp. TaxID=1720 RepID=UPI0026DDB010|nr:DNA polymerase Y family protein [Corynebacterium sp.]MDO5099819.1 DNA polymerase Y family protein [Corynebacterium sp.]
MRVLALWFPDWPVQAALAAQCAEGGDAVVVVKHNTVTVSNVSARKAGIRRGMSVRQAQALHPKIVVVSADPERDARYFLNVAEQLDQVVATAEIIRPGLVLIDATAAARYHGSEEIVAQHCLDAFAHCGNDCSVGIADDITTAIIAARAGSVVGEGRAATRRFLAQQPTKVLMAEPALGCEAETVVALMHVGLHTLGDIAALDTAALATRFGRAGARCHAIATGRYYRTVSSPPPGAELAVTLVPELPINRVDTAAFAARHLAAQLHQRLKAHGLVCLRLKVQAVIGTDAEQDAEHVVERVWRTKQALTEAATADRVRWQLDGWLTSRNLDNAGLIGGDDAGGESAAGIIQLILDPIECAVPEETQLWGDNVDEKAARVIARVQSQLGIDKVLQPYEIGGRGVVDRIAFATYGDCPAAETTVTPWVGAIPPPFPAVIIDPAAGDASAAIFSDANVEVYVTADVVLSAKPAVFSWAGKKYQVIGWAGPWPILGKWWDNQRPYARIQLVAMDKRDRPHAWLVRWAGRWKVEATYQ